MTLAKHNYHTAAAIPPHLTPDDVLAALHNHDTCLSLQALTSGHELLPSTEPAILKDTFWYPTDRYPPSTYRVTEVIAYLPWFSWAKYDLVFPSVFQSTPTGLKTRADTNGVVLRAEFRVLEGSKIEGAVEGEGQGLGDVDWVLVEDVEVMCAWWMMPFVKGKMEDAHRDICRKVVEKVAREKVEREREAPEANATAGIPLSSSQAADGVDPPVAVQASHTGEHAIPQPQESKPEKITYG